MVKTALAIMVGVTLAQHLGLTEAVAQVVGKIASCSMCCTFWSILIVGLWMGQGILLVAGLSILFAYGSHWFGLLLIRLNKTYNRLWERLRKIK